MGDCCRVMELEDAPRSGSGGGQNGLDLVA